MIEVGMQVTLVPRYDDDSFFDDVGYMQELTLKDQVFTVVDQTGTNHFVLQHDNEPLLDHYVWRSEDLIPYDEMTEDDPNRIFKMRRVK